VDLFELGVSDQEVPELWRYAAAATGCEFAVAPEQLRRVGLLSGRGVEGGLEGCPADAVPYDDCFVVAVEEGHWERPAVEFKEPFRGPV
jgi:hypothetical protein